MILKPLAASIFEQAPADMQVALRQSGVVPVADPILPLWQAGKEIDTAVLIGGRGGLKTHGVSDFIAHQAAVNKKRCVILRDEKSLIKASILNEILNRFDAIPFDTGTERLHTGLQDKESKVDTVFTMGFKASDNKKKANMKGISDIDIAVIEEAEDIVDPDKFNTFVDSLRKEGCLVIVILNTPDVGHFILRTYFDCNIPAPIPDDVPEVNKKEFEGFFQVRPKQNIPGFLCIQTDYRQNKYLPHKILTRYEAYKNPDNHLYNPHYYMTAIMGYASTGRKGQVLKKAKPISLKEYMALPYTEIYGLDFGTSSPAGLVGVKFNKNNCYARQLNYKPLNTLEIGILLCTLGIKKIDRIIADHADKIAWQTLRRGFTSQTAPTAILKKYPQLLQGFNVIPCTKNGIKEDIDLIDTMNLFVVNESTDFWEEIRMRIFAQDKNGNYTNDPEPGHDHLQDPLIYVVVDQRGKPKFRITTSNN